MESSKKINILIPDRITKSESVFEQEIFGQKYQLTVPCAKFTSDIKENTWKNTEGILAWHELQYTKEIVKKLEKCKIIVRAGVGFDNVDLETTGEKGIYVCNVPDYGTNDVADHAITLILSFMRGINSFNEQVKQKCTWSWQDGGILKRIKDSVLGIIGLGRIGTATAIRAKSFGMKVCFYDPYIPDGFDKALGIKNTLNLDTLLEMSDVISIHTPLTDETLEMVDETFLKKMKKGAILVNTARGEITNLDAIYEALKVGKLKAVGLDVLPNEPPDNKNCLIKAWREDESWLKGRLLITPHAAFFNEESYKELRHKATSTIKDFFEGNKPKNIVNKNYLNYKNM